MRTVGTSPRPTMERRRFGPTGREVAVIGQGTWYLERADRASAIAALRRGVDLGMTHIDTAELYGSGTVEEMVGEAISHSLRVSTQPKSVEPEPGRRYIERQQPIRSMSRLFEFPVEIDTDRIRATLDHGILKVHVPKAASSRPRVIEIEQTD